MAPVKRKAGETTRSSPPAKRIRDIQTTAASTRPKRETKAHLQEDQTTLAEVKSSLARSASSRKKNVNTKSSKTKASETTKSTKASRSKSTKSGVAQRSGSNVSVEVPKTRVSSAEREQRADDEDAENEGRSYWLMKAEPESRIEKGVDVKFSIDDLARKGAPEPWDGVRNPTARNNMRAMMKGDLAFFYHSNCKVPGIVGVMEIVQEHSVDVSAFEKEHPYFDPKSVRDKPKWCVVHVDFRMKFDEIIPLKDLQRFSKQGGILESMQVLKMSRLSVSNVRKKEWDFILGLADVDPTAFKAIDMQREASSSEDEA